MSSYCKFYKEQKYISDDGGSTWSATTEYRKGALIEADSPDCGYVPPTPTSAKFTLTLQDSSIVSAECATNTIRMDEIDAYRRTCVSAVIGDCVIRIDSWAFINCSGLTSVVIPNSVTDIGDTAFAQCYSLTSVTIPSGLTSINSSAFHSCTSLSSVTIPSGVTSIGDSAFDGCALTSITIPSNVTSIGEFAFAACWNLTSVTIPNSVSGIGKGAFNYCTSLSSVTIGSGITSIGVSAFTNCSALTSVTINATTPPILGDVAFSNTNNCPIYVPCDSVDAYKAANYWRYYANRITCITEPQYRTTSGTPYCNSYDKYLDIYSQVSYDSGVTWTTTATTPTLVEINSPDCGYGKYSLTLNDSSRVTAACDSTSAITETEIDPYRTSIVSATIGDCVTSIGDMAFYYCDLSAVTIPNSITSIGYGSFADCMALSSITIPSSVTNIGDMAFYECVNLTTVTCEATVPPTLTDLAFGIDLSAIYVPAESVDVYKEASGWSSYESLIQPIS